MDVQTTAAEMRSPNGDATATLSTANRYVGDGGAEHFWNVVVHPTTRQGQSYRGHRTTFEGAQQLASAALILADRVVETDRAATTAAADLAALLRSQPAPETTTVADPI